MDQQQLVGNNYGYGYAEGYMQAWNNGTVMEVWVRIQQQYPSDPYKQQQAFRQWCYENGWHDREIEALINMVTVTPMDSDMNFMVDEWSKREGVVLATISFNLESLDEADKNGKGLFCKFNRSFIEDMVQDTSKERQIVNVGKPLVSTNSSWVNLELTVAKQTQKGLESTNIRHPIMARIAENHDSTGSLTSLDNTPIDLDVDESSWDTVDECLEQLGPLNEPIREMNPETNKKEYKQKIVNYKVPPDHRMHHFIKTYYSDQYPTQQDNAEDPYTYDYIVPVQDARLMAEKLVHGSVKKRFKCRPSELRLLVRPADSIFVTDSKPIQSKATRGRYDNTEKISKVPETKSINSYIIAAASIKDPLKGLKANKEQNILKSNLILSVKCPYTYLERKAYGKSEQN